VEEIEMSWNPRYVIYAYAHDKRTPEEMGDFDRERYPGGCMTGFILWMDEQWAEFRKFFGCKREFQTGFQNEFDAWLIEHQYPEYPQTDYHRGFMDWLRGNPSFDFTGKLKQ
jgi:hypothetical protein